MKRQIRKFKKNKKREKIKTSLNMKKIKKMKNQNMEADGLCLGEEGVPSPLLPPPPFLSRNPFFFGGRLSFWERRLYPSLLDPSLPSPNWHPPTLRPGWCCPSSVTVPVRQLDRVTQHGVMRSCQVSPTCCARSSRQRATTAPSSTWH